MTGKQRRRTSFLFVLLLAGSVALGLPGCGGKEETTPLAVQLRDAMNISDPSRRVIELIKVADTQKAAQLDSDAQQTLASARAACGEITEPLAKAEAYTRLAKAQAEMGYQRQARDTVKDIRGMLGEVTDIEPLIEMRCELAEVQGKYLDNASGAQYELSEGEKAVASLPDTKSKVRALLDLAETSHGLEMSAEAERLIGVARETANEGEAKQQSESLAEIGVTLSKWQQADEATALFNQAVEVAGGIQDPWQRGYALYNIAVSMIGAGRRDAAASVLDSADAAATQIGDSKLREELYAKIGEYR